MVLLELFWAFFKVGLFAIGGAYSFLPLMEEEVVQNHQWLARAEFLEVVGMVELFPGAISIKFATYTGYKVAGISGAIVANVANMLPPVLFVAFASMLYMKYKGAPAIRGALGMVQYAVIGMLLAIAVKLASGGQLFSLKVMPVVVLAFVLLTATRVHPAFIIAGAALYGGFAAADL